MSEWRLRPPFFLYDEGGNSWAKKKDTKNDKVRFSVFPRVQQSGRKMSQHQEERSSLADPATFCVADDRPTAK